MRQTFALPLLITISVLLLVLATWLIRLLWRKRRARKAAPALAQEKS
jgi:hypothetical protein